jgi:hypothetical protein
VGEDLGLKPQSVSTSIPTGGRFRNAVRKISKRTLIIPLLALVFLGISLVLEKTSDPSIHSIWSGLVLAEFIRDVALALVIAFAVIATIEHESREEFGLEIRNSIRNIQENVFSSTFERHIPRSVLAEINELIFSASFIRIKHVANYNMKRINFSELAKRGPSMDLVQIEMASDYTVQNVGNIPKPFEIKLSVEKQPIAELHEFVSVDLVSLEIEGQKIPSPKKQEFSDANELRGVWVTPDIPPGAKFRVETKSQVVKFKTDYEIWRSYYPTEELRISVSFPDGAHSHGAEALHRLPLRKRSIGEHLREFEVAGAVLPHQGVVIWWCCDPMFPSDLNGTVACSKPSATMS